MAKEFSLDDVEFQAKEMTDMEQLPFVKPSSTVAVETMGFFEADNRTAEQMECDEQATATANVKEKAVSAGLSVALLLLRVFDLVV